MNTEDPRLDRRLDEVPRDVPPARDLWPAIAARLEPREAGTGEPAGAAARTARPARRTAWATPPYALAATLAFLALTVALSWQLGRPSPGGGPAVALQGEGSAAAPAADDGPLLPVAASDAEYQRTRRELEATFRERLALLAPATRAKVLENLEIIRRAEAEIRAALEADPASRVLQQLQQSTRRQEIDLYATIGRTTDPALTRTTT